MNDQRLLEDIKELHSMINIAFKPLLNDANQIKTDTERIVQEIGIKYQSHENTIERIKEFSDRLEGIGGASKFSELLDRLTINNQLLNQYSNLTEQIDKSLEKYSELQNPLEIQLERTTTAKNTLIEAHNQIEELRAFCAELLEVRELLRSIGGSRGLYASMEEVTNLISRFKSEWQDLEASLSGTYNQGISLLSQLREKQESAIQFLAIDENLAKKITFLEGFIIKFVRLERSIHNDRAVLQSTQTNLTDIKDYAKKLDLKIQSVHQEFIPLQDSINSQQAALVDTSYNLDYALEQFKELNQQVQSHNSDIQTVNKKFIALDRAVNSYGNSLSESNKSVESLESDVKSLESNVASNRQRIQKWINFKALTGLFVLGLTGGVFGSLITIAVWQCSFSGNQSQICRPSR